MNRDLIKDQVIHDIQAAEKFFESYVKPKIVERYQIYNASPEYYEKIFRKLAQRSSVVSSDVADTIEWVLPSLMRIFWGSEDVITVIGREQEDQRRAEIMQKLINFQIQILNPGFLIFYRWFKDALIAGLGIVKCWWEREVDTIHVQQVMSDEELQALEASHIKIIRKEKAENNVYWYVTYAIEKILKNQPIIANVPPYEIIYHPDSSSIANSSFVAHRKLVTADYLRRRVQEGVYEKEAVERALSKGEANTYYDYLESVIRPQQSLFTRTSIDEAKRQFLLYECYTQLDINNDGLLEKVIVTICNDEILRIEENHYGRPPFFVISPILEPYEIWGKGFSDVLADVQAIKTALIRQILVNIALNNEPKLAVVETGVNLQDLILDKEFIRVRQPGAIAPLPVQPLAGWTFNFLEYIENMKENRTGITRYNQGLDARSLNKTATGIQLIMSAAQQRLELIARIFAETGVKELFRFLVELNQKFITQDVVLRLTNETLKISADDLSGVFDLEVAAGIGVGAKEQQLMNLQMILQYLPQLVQIGIATPRNVYFVFKKMLENMGFKNTQEFIQEPKEVPLESVEPITQAQGGIISQVTQGLNGQRAGAAFSGIFGGGENEDISDLANILSRGLA